jgi:two-component system sensor kinase FixL
MALSWCWVLVQWSRCIRQSQAADRWHALSVLAAMSLGVAHELNQPLTAAGNFLRAGIRMAQAERPDPARADAAREAMREASAQILRAGEILRRLRDFIGRGETEQHLVSLGPLVADGVALVTAAHRGVSPPIALDVGAAGCVIMADEVQMQQVFVNLLRNAIEATEGLPQRGIAVSLHREGGRAVLRFRDAGPGLPPEVRERLFLPFVTTKEGGMGIGLSICRAIVEAHGGRISAPVPAAGGTEILMELPLAQAALAAMGEATVRPESESRLDFLERMARFDDARKALDEVSA